jgi:hypothetical protein
MLAFYLAFQLEDNELILSYYREGLSAYWNHINRTECNMWYYIYQLAYPSDENIRDWLGNNILDVSSWHLSRYPIDTTRYQAYIHGSRTDVVLDAFLSTNPFITKGNRTNTGDI